MKWFKMDWLTGSKDREKIRKTWEVTTTASPIIVEPTDKVYRNVIFSNGNIVVIFHDGTMITKTGVDTDFVNRVRQCTSRAEIEAMFEVVLAIKADTVDTSDEKALIAKNLGIFRNRVDFEVKGNDVYLKGVNLSMPSVVVASFIEILEKMAAQSFYTNVLELEEQLVALKMFWLKLAMNSLPLSREDLLVFVRHNDVRITKNGNLVLYRRIVSLGQKDKPLVKYVSQQYYGMKKTGKPQDWAVVDLGKGNYGLVKSDKIKKEKVVGNLKALYLNLPNMEDNTFTSAHQGRGKKTSIKVGGLYEIPDSEINLDNGLCAAGGLHAAAVDYDYSGFGDTAVVVLVNPSKAITVPRGEIGKLRTTQMFVACVNDKPRGVHFDEGALSAFDDEYHTHTLKELEEAVSSKSFETMAVIDNVPAISLVDLATIKDMLKNRISTVV